MKKFVFLVFSQYMTSVQVWQKEETVRCLALQYLSVKAMRTLKEQAPP